MSQTTKVSPWLDHDGYGAPGDDLALRVEGVRAKALAMAEGRIAIDWFAFGDPRDGAAADGLGAKDAAEPLDGPGASAAAMHSPPVLDETAIAKVLRVLPDTGPDTGPDTCPAPGLAGADAAAPFPAADWIGGGWASGLDYV